MGSKSLIIVPRFGCPSITCQHNVCNIPLLQDLCKFFLNFICKFWNQALTDFSSLWNDVIRLQSSSEVLEIFAFSSSKWQEIVTQPLNIKSVQLNVSLAPRSFFLIIHPFSLFGQSRQQPGSILWTDFKCYTKLKTKN